MANRSTASRNAILFGYRSADNAQPGGTGPSRGQLVRGKESASVRMMAGTFKIRDAPGRSG